MTCALGEGTWLGSCVPNGYRFSTAADALSVFVSLLWYGVLCWQVHPPQRFIEVYYNTWADDFYTAITTSSNRFGPRWWFREALSHSASDVMAWLRKWYRMAKKHRVLHDDVAAMLSEALREEDDDSGPVLSETQRYDALKDRIRRWREPRIIAIGDVHGCIEELRALLKVRPGTGTEQRVGVQP